MKIINHVKEIINSSFLKRGSRIYASGNASTPQVMLKQMTADPSIKDVDLMGVLFLGNISELFSKECCERINHKIIFNSHLTREAVNKGWAQYLLMHLSDIPKQISTHLKPNVVMLSIAGPDQGGNYSLGTTVEGMMSALKEVRDSGGLVIAERNINTPFVLGCTIPESWIDYMIETDYSLPTNPVNPVDSDATRIGQIIVELFISDKSTIQYGIGQVPEAVTSAIISKGVKDLGIYTELFADAMRRLVEEEIVTNKFTSSRNNFSVATIFLSESKEGYDWLNYNSSIQSRPTNLTNNIVNISQEPNMVSINSAIGVDLHGNIWADSMRARKIYSGVGGQCDFIRGANAGDNGVAIIALKSKTSKGISKITDMCPEGITTTAIAADPVIIVTEYGAFDPRGLSLSERAVGIAHLAAPEYKDDLLKKIYDGPQFHCSYPSNRTPSGFIAFEQL